MKHTDHQYVSRPFKYWPSTREDIQCPPLQRDPYECTVLEVGESRVEGGGEGAYARKNLQPGTVVAYYNGLRFKSGEKSPFHDTGYAIFVEWNRKSLYGCKKGEHMDIPPKVTIFPSARPSPGKSCKRRLRTFCRKSRYFENFLSKYSRSFE